MLDNPYALIHFGYQFYTFQSHLRKTIFGNRFFDFTRLYEWYSVSQMTCFKGLFHNFLTINVDLTSLTAYLDPGHHNTSHDFHWELNYRFANIHEERELLSFSHLRLSCFTTKHIIKWHSASEELFHFQI